MKIFKFLLIIFEIKHLCQCLGSQEQEYEKEIEHFKNIYLNNQKLNSIALGICEKDSYFINTTQPCLIPFKKRTSTRRFKRMIGSVLSKLGGIAKNIPSLLGDSDSSSKQEELEKQESNLKIKFDGNQLKMQEFLNENKFEKPELKDSLNELHISNDVSFNGFDEFKFGDLKISVIEDNLADATGTSINIDFPFGIGLYISNECYREINNPECSKLFEQSKKTSQQSCGDSMIPSAHVIGTGFLISKDGVDKTRRKSLITRLCNKPIKYGGSLIPDGITIAEIYDSEAHSVFFTDTNQFLTYLSSSYGLSITNEELNSFSSTFGGGLPLLSSFTSTKEKINKHKYSKTNNKDKTSQTSEEKQSLLSIFEINVIRYALFIENVRPEHIDPFFLIDFMSLPENYFLEDAVLKYEKFLFRYGTHYIHSAEFGGQILFQNTRVVESESNMNDEAAKSWNEIQTAFGSSTSVGGGVNIPVSFLSANAGGKIEKIQTNDFGEKKKNENYEKLTESKQRNWTSVFLQSQGGNINIAKLITRLESNTGSALLEWLRSIPRYPKAFKVKMRPINELLNFNVRNLFINEIYSSEICKKSSTRLCVHGTNVEEFQKEFDKRRRSLEFAIEIFRHRNDYQFSDLEIEPGTPETCLFSVHAKSSLFPNYEEILNGTEIKVVIELDADYNPFYRGEEIYLMYHNKLWFSKKRDESYNFLSTYKMPKNTTINKPIVIRNLIFDYNQTSGELVFKQIGKNLESRSSYINLKHISVYKSSENEHWNENGLLYNQKIGQVSYANVLQGIEKAKADRFFIMPCNLDWSSANSRRFSVSQKYGKCLKFIASSLGDIFVVFATNPNNEYTWYFVQISSYGVSLYKSGLVVKYKLDPNSGSLKNADLFRRFFICINYESRNTSHEYSYDNSSYSNSNLNSNKLGLYIQYGIIQGYDSKETVHLNYFDYEPLEPRYYMFGSLDSKVFVYDITVNTMTKDEQAELRCSKGFLNEFDEIYCKSICHDNCVGCTKSNSSYSCVKCRYDSIIDDNRLICLETCPYGYRKNNLLHKCEDIDECNQTDTFVLYKNQFKTEIYKWQKCSANSLCINKQGSYECKCLNGYSGDGFVCEDINECDFNSTDSSLIANCPINSECVNKKGGYECSCLNGFKKVENTCQDLDECLLEIHECQINSKCINIPGSYKCVCIKGFKGNGIYCEDLNECELKIDNCNENSRCINNQGSYSCQCVDGFKFENNSCFRILKNFKKHQLNIEDKINFTQAFNKPVKCLKEKNFQIESQFIYCTFKNNCDPNSDCIYDLKTRKYSCKCWPGFIGNGYKCYDSEKFFYINNKICRRQLNQEVICV